MIVISVRDANSFARKPTTEADDRFAEDAAYLERLGVATKAPGVAHALFDFLATIPLFDRQCLIESVVMEMSRVRAIRRWSS